MTDDLEEYENNNTKFIKKLHDSSREDMMELVYKSIIEDDMGALKHDAPVEDKIEGVYSVLNFFKEREEYEKCLELNKIINKLEDVNS
jgi:hypothetical protein